ncbi:hypothetical protein SKAU_G00223100 [Synaphobranchus kaupii]|uniref:Uncharacterized protein n=1 Tax=Synaphobranchus kaupii TaxID=118154 RepID=A0A9Q1FB55_SYNKA|nr:hypothetical protein SKAU_G00223100 [Synaphobranchus kaupii]
MNRKHCRPLTDRKNVLQVFTKHTKSRRDVRDVPDCNSDSSHATKTAGTWNTCKVKRLKTRKERCSMRGERGQDIHPPCCHQSRRENKTEHSHSSYNCPLQPASKGNTMAEHGPEPCIITDGRLIGHRGLFNREVKSVDIERLVSDNMKSKVHRRAAAGVHSGACEDNRTVTMPSCTPPSPAPGPADFSVYKLAAEAWLQEKAERTRTASSRGQSVSQRQKSRSQKDDRGPPRSSAAERDVEQHADSSGREHGNVCTPQQPPKDRRPLAFRTQSCKPDPPLAGPTAAPGARSCEERLQRRAADCAGVAARLCHTVQLPVLCRRNLLAESREALLQVLQERHGPQLTENLLRLEQHVSHSAGGPEAHGADLRKDSNSDAQACGYKENVAWWEQSRPSASGLACSRRRRKQLFPQRVEPRLPEPRQDDTVRSGTPMYLAETSASSLHAEPSSLHKMMQWNPGVIADLAGDSSGVFTKTNSPQLFMDFLPSLSSSPPAFMSSAWGVHTRQQLTQDRPFRNRPERATVAGEHVQNSGYSPEMCFFRQTKNPENARPPFLQYSAFPVEGSPRDAALWPQRPAVSEMSNFRANSPPPLHRPHSHIHLQTHNSIHQPLPILRSYSSDRIYYPRSDLQERDLSPPLPLLPSYPSPDPWSFPRMRLY